MPRPRRLLAACLVASAAVATGCGDHHIAVSKSEGTSVQRGAQLFRERCSGCHSLEAADALADDFELHLTRRQLPNDGKETTRRQGRGAILFDIGFETPADSDVQVGRSQMDLFPFGL